jgi:hypothetical protein
LVSYIILIMGAHGRDFDAESQEFGTENADALEFDVENAAREPENSDNAEYAAATSSSADHHLLRQDGREQPTIAAAPPSRLRHRYRHAAVNHSLQSVFARQRPP